MLKYVYWHIIIYFVSKSFLENLAIVQINLYL